MQLNRCPVCHTRMSLDAMTQDEAGRELLGLLAKLDIDTGSALVGYLGLFRSKSRDLANDRALRLAKEALALGDPAAVACAMRKTVDSLLSKGGKPLADHNYLRRVLEDVGQGDAVVLAAGGRDEGLRPVKSSKTALALDALEGFGHE